MRSSRIAVALLLLSLASAGALRAQDDAADVNVPDASTDFGNLVTPELVNETLGARPEADEPPRVDFFFSPSATDVDGAPIAGLMFGGVYEQVQLDLRYQNIGSADGSTNFDQFRLRGKYAVPKPSSRRWGLAFLGQYVDTREASTQTTGLVIASLRLTTDKPDKPDTTKLQIYGNVGWSEKEPNGREAISDAVRVAGLSFAIGVVEIGLEYTFGNDITKSEDDYNLTARQQIGEGKLGFGAGKGGVVFASYTISFHR